MATTTKKTTDAISTVAPANPDLAPDAGDLTTGAEAADVLEQFHATHQVPAGYSISRDALGWNVRKL